MKRTLLKRYTPIQKKRPTQRRGEPTNDEKTAAREFIYNLSGGRCELTFNGEKLPGCHRGVLPPEGDVLERWHLVHMGARRRFGWPTTGPRRMRGGCHYCHIEMMHQKGMRPDEL